MKSGAIGRKDLFRRLLGGLWLRPESALWYSHMLYAARKFSAHRLPRPCLDFGCMDGLNSFLLMNGTTPEKFDIFDEVRIAKSDSCSGLVGNDYYDRIKVGTRWEVTRVRRKFDLGLVWKKSHMTKAGRFGAHKNLFLWKPGSPLRDIPSSSLGGVWAPNLYWMQDLSQILREFARVVRPQGRVVTIGPDASLSENMLARLCKGYDARWLQRLDRGRSENAKKGKTLEGWNRLFRRSGLQILRHERFLPPAVNLAYEIGLRPMFEALVEMRNLALREFPGKYLSFKRDWIRRLLHLSAPLLRDSSGASKGGQLWHIFELTPLPAKKLLGQGRISQSGNKKGRA